MIMIMMRMFLQNVTNISAHEILDISGNQNKSEKLNANTID